MVLVTIEGVDGVGKTTLIRHLRKSLSDYTVFTQEPYRLMIHKTDYSPLEKLWLFMADHQSHVQNVICPAIHEYRLIISDRYIDSRVAYGMEQLKGIVPSPRQFILNLHVASPKPHLTILLTANMSTIAERRPDEDRDLLERVNKNYQLLHANEGRNSHFMCVNADRPIETIGNEVIHMMRDRQCFY